MTRLDISIGSSANDGTGDTLRSAGNKINLNFKELYTQLGGDSSTLSTQVTLDSDAVTFEGTSDNDFETRLKVTNPTQDNIITLPDSTGTVTLDNTVQTLTNKTLTAPTIASITNGGTITIPSGAGTITTIAASQTLTNKTLTTPIINSPTIGTLINDANGNEIIKLTATGSAVNELTIANGASTTGPALSATGTGSNLNLSLTAKGAGSVELNKAAFSSDEFDSNGHNGGMADSSSSLIICNSGTPLAVGLTNGTTTGEFKIFTNKGAGMATITPTNFANGTSIQLPQNRATQCIWDGAKWFMLTARDSSNSIIVI